MPYVKLINMQLLNKKTIGTKNMFALNMPKKICINVLDGLKNQATEDSIGWRLMLLHASSLKN
jgi:hypothetical protein